MAGAYVQDWSEANATNTTTLTVTVSGATANNLLVAFVYVNLGGDSFTTPSGWTFIDDFSDGNDGHGAYYRWASGTSADDFTPVWTDSGQAAGFVAEWSGLDSAANMEDGSAVYAASGASHTGPTVTPTTSNGLGIAAFIANYNDFVGLTWGGGYTEDVYTATSRWDGWWASKVYTSTASHTPSISTTDTGNEGHFLAAVFKEAGGGGGPTIPIFDHHYRMMH